LNQWKRKQLSATALSQWVNVRTQEEKQKEQLQSIRWDRHAYIHKAELTPSPSFRIAGISFDNRQCVLKSVTESDAVLFDRQPSNEYDKNAVRVSLLDGRLLGYVPRDLTSIFEQQLTTGGRIKSIGRGQGQYMGAIVQGYPRLPSLLPPFLPKQFREHMDPFKKLTDDQNQMIVKYLKKRDEWGCAFTGVKEDLVPCVLWRVDPHWEQFETSGIRLVHREFMKVVNMQNDEDHRLLGILAAVNEWTAEEAKMYVRYCIERRDQVDRQTESSWKVIVSAFPDLCREANITVDLTAFT